MKLPSPLIAALTCALLYASATAQSLKDAKTTFKIENWSVLRSVDTMTDSVSCTGIYKSNFGVQLAKNALYVKIPGGIQSVTLRFGDEPSLPLRLPEKMEKEVGSVIIEGRDLSRVLETNRLRIQALTLVKGLASEDFDTTGIQKALDHIRSGCSAPEIPPLVMQSVAVPPPPAPAPAADSKPAADAEKPCSEQLIARLKSNRVTEKQIRAACR